MFLPQKYVTGTYKNSCYGVERSSLQSLAMRRQKFPTEVRLEPGYGLDDTGFQYRQV